MKDGDDYIINGTRVYTSSAEGADYICWQQEPIKRRQSIKVSLCLLWIAKIRVSALRQFIRWVMFEPI
ncbi:hypothetical protein [Endozoicomonas sp.]|uniref:hypothetical protein n=1 Tax=Endozoicomonas sp. TaxID=1892382 RepID=UPI00383BC43A